MKYDLLLASITQWSVEIYDKLQPKKPTTGHVLKTTKYAILLPLSPRLQSAIKIGIVAFFFQCKLSVYINSYLNSLFDYQVFVKMKFFL